MEMNTRVDSNDLIQMFVKRLNGVCNSMALLLNQLIFEVGPV